MRVFSYFSSVKYFLAKNEVITKGTIVPEDDL